MVINLAYGILTMAICLFLEMALLMVVLRYYAKREHLLKESTYWFALRILSGVMTVLIIGILVQVGIWALLFMGLGEFEEFSVAFYHSAVNFGTLGYGDMVMSEAHRLLGPLQAINGVLMIGISTAVLMAAVQQVMDEVIQKILERNGHIKS